MLSCRTEGLSHCHQMHSADTLGRTARRTRTTEKKDKKVVRAMAKTNQVPCAVLYGTVTAVKTLRAGHHSTGRTVTSSDIVWQAHRPALKKHLPRQWAVSYVSTRNRASTVRRLEQPSSRGDHGDVSVAGTLQTFTGTVYQVHPLSYDACETGTSKYQQVKVWHVSNAATSVL